MAYTLQHQHGKVAWRIFEPFLYIKNEFWENNWVKQGFGILFGLDLIGFWDSRSSPGLPGGQIVVPKLSQSQVIPRIWKSGVETKIFLLDPWRTGMFLRWRFSWFCLIEAPLMAFFTTKAHQTSRYWTFTLYLTPRKLQGSSRDPSWAGGPLEPWQGEWHNRGKFP